MKKDAKKKAGFFARIFLTYAFFFLVECLFASETLANQVATVDILPEILRDGTSDRRRTGNQIPTFTVIENPPNTSIFKGLMTFRSFSVLLAIVLATAAVLKLHMLLTDPFADIKSGYPAPLLWLAVFAEIAVVGVIFFQPRVELKWLSLTSLFVVFAAVAAFNAITGKTSCGCAGVIEIHPVWFLAFDVVVTAGLFVTKPMVVLNEIAKSIRTPGIAGNLSGLAFAVGLFLLTQIAPVKSRVNQYFMGREINASPIRLGGFDSLEPVNCVVRLENVSSQETKIIGVAKSCTCVGLGDCVGQSIPPNGELNVEMQVVPKQFGPFHQRILFYLDSPQQNVVAADMFGQFKENGL